MRDQHVDPRLRVRVDPARDPERDRGIERRDLDLDVQPRAGGVVLGAAGDVDLEEAVALVALGGDEDAVADPPADDPVLVVHRVLRRVEAQQHERAADEHDGALGRRVDDADQPERHAREVLPVRAGEPLEVHRRPDRLERLRGHRQVGGLDGPDRALVVEQRLLLGVADDRVRHALLVAAVEELHASAALTASSKPIGASLIPAGGAWSTSISSLSPSTSGRTRPNSTGVTSAIQ